MGMSLKDRKQTLETMQVGDRNQQGRERATMKHRGGGTKWTRGLGQGEDLTFYLKCKEQS